MLDKLAAIKQRFEDLKMEMTDPKAISNRKRFIQLSKDYKE